MARLIGRWPPTAWPTTTKRCGHCIPTNTILQRFLWFSSGIGGVLIIRSLRGISPHPKVCFLSSLRRSLVMRAALARSPRTYIAFAARYWVDVLYYMGFGIFFFTTNDVLYDDLNGPLIMDILSLAFWYTRVACDAPLPFPCSRKARSTIKFTHIVHLVIFSLPDPPSAPGAATNSFAPILAHSSTPTPRWRLMLLDSSPHLEFVRLRLRQSSSAAHRSRKRAG